MNIYEHITYMLNLLNPQYCNIFLFLKFNANNFTDLVIVVVFLPVSRICSTNAVSKPLHMWSWSWSCCSWTTCRVRAPWWRCCATWRNSTCATNLEVFGWLGVHQNHPNLVLRKTKGETGTHVWRCLKNPPHWWTHQKGESTVNIDNRIFWSYIPFGYLT